METIRAPSSDAPRRCRYDRGSAGRPPSVARASATAWCARLKRARGSFTADLPAQLGGTGAAPTPGVFGRAAFGSGLAVGYMLHAAKLRVPIASLEVEVPGRLRQRRAVRHQQAPTGIPGGPLHRHGGEHRAGTRRAAGDRRGRRAQSVSPPLHEPATVPPDRSCDVATRGAMNALQRRIQRDGWDQAAARYRAIVAAPTRARRTGRCWRAPRRVRATGSSTSPAAPA